MWRKIVAALLGALADLNLGPIFFDESGSAAAAWFIVFAAAGAAVALVIESRIGRSRK